LDIKGSDIAGDEGKTRRSKNTMESEDPTFLVEGTPRMNIRNTDTLNSEKTIGPQCGGEDPTSALEGTIKTTGPSHEDGAGTGGRKMNDGGTNIEESGRSWKLNYSKHK
jgi:hypothetical protein